MRPTSPVRSSHAPTLAATQTPPTSIDLRLLISMENAEGLLAMGAMFSPELATLQIEPNGEPVPLELMQLAAMGMTVHMAMTDSAIALSLGESDDKLSAMLDADVADPAPFMTMDMDAARYYEFINAVMAAAPQSGENAAMTEAIAGLYATMSETMDRMAMSIDFTDNGVEMSSTVTLAD